VFSIALAPLSHASMATISHKPTIARPLNAYALFYRDMYKKMSRSGEKLPTVTTFAKAVGSQWRTLSDADKKVCVYLYSISGNVCFILLGVRQTSGQFARTI
jgi:hypothetical protein